MNDKKRLNRYEDLPLVLDVADIQRIMGISRASAYEDVYKRQMFGRGATDINDLITNTVGACLGFFIYQLLSKLVSKELRCV